MKKIIEFFKRIFGKEKDLEYTEEEQKEIIEKIFKKIKES